MTRSSRFDTREHILNIGEQLCAQSGFNGTGLIELLKQADVPKGSFYYYFPSKEAFGVAMIERYFVHYVQNMRTFFNSGEEDLCLRVLDYYQQSADKWDVHQFAGCLAVKLSAEVCDLSDEMRTALATGATALISTLTAVLQEAQKKGWLSDTLSAGDTAKTLYMLWMGASLHSKICRSSEPMKIALKEITHILRRA